MDMIDSMIKVNVKLWLKSRTLLISFKVVMRGRYETWRTLSKKRQTSSFKLLYHVLISLHQFLDVPNFKFDEALKIVSQVLIISRPKPQSSKHTTYLININFSNFFSKFTNLNNVLKFAQKVGPSWFKMGENKWKNQKP